MLWNDVILKNALHCEKKFTCLCFPKTMCLPLSSLTITNNYTHLYANINMYLYILFFARVRTRYFLVNRLLFKHNLV